jgi:hypothetical protein
VQASIANSGQTGSYAQGAPVALHVPPDALRVLAPGAPAMAIGSGVDAEGERAPAVATH